MPINTPSSPMLLEVHRLLDSKIQSLEHQAEHKFQECICSQAVASDLPNSNNKAATLTENFDRMLLEIEACNNQLKQLQTIKCWLLEDNLTKVLELLQDDNYLQFGIIRLEQMLKKSALQRIRFKFSRQTTSA